MLAFVGLVAGLVGYYWIDRTILSTLPRDLSEYRTWRPPGACLVFDRNGKAIDEFYIDRRIWVPIDELDPWTWQAFIAAEDRRFMDHRGVDPAGIARAVWVNWASGRDIQGASTLTQQLVKNLIVGKKRSYDRKIREAILAYRLEQEMSKKQILELYINYVALGSGNYGVEAAAQDYFGISARDLDAGQAAELAGLVPAPSRYSPRSDPDTAAQRRRLVLRSMVDMGFLTQEAADAYLDDPVLLDRPGERRGPGTAYVTQVRREVRRVLGDFPFQRGLRVDTPFDLATQATAEASVAAAIEALERRQGVRGPIRRVPRAEWDGWLAENHGLRSEPTTHRPAFPEPDACFQALVKKDLSDLHAGVWRFSLRGADRDALTRDTSPEAKPKPLSRLVAPGDVLSVCLDGAGTGDGVDGVVRTDGRPWAQGAAVVLENQTGSVVALVGGTDVGLEGFVRATQARRQPGSSFKPYVYAAALLGGHLQTDTVLDAPISLPGASGAWSPKNYSGGYAGALPMRRALAKSLNTVSVRLTLEAGVSQVVRTARAMGVATPLRSDPTIALGSSEVTPMDQAIGYSTIARMGVRAEPVFIEGLRDVDGAVLAKAGDPVVVGDTTVGALPGGPGVRVMPAGVAYELADMLREVVISGTARRAFKRGFDRAGKTGTTNDYIDAWFVGFTPRYTIAVWIGTDGTRSLGDQETGGKTALPAWIHIANVLPDVEGERIALPDDAILVPWQGTWIGVPRGKVPNPLLEQPRDPGDAPLPWWPDGSKPGKPLPLPALAVAEAPADEAPPGPPKSEVEIVDVAAPPR
jgi:penicillin-binding protein 1A